MIPELVIQTENPKKFERFQKEYAGSLLLEITKAGDGNNLLYVVCDLGYDQNLWRNDLAEKIGSTCWGEL